MEAGDDPKEAGSRAALGPEQIDVLLLVGPDQLALGGHHIDCGDLFGGLAPATQVPPRAALNEKPPSPTLGQPPV